MGYSWISLRRGLPGIAATVLATGLAAPFAPAGAQSLTTLHSFTGGADGAVPQKGPTRDTAGNLYGTTYWGAKACPDSYQYANVGCGTVWKLDTSNTFTTLVTFNGKTNGADGSKEGADPDGNLTLYKGFLYGTTFAGGGADQGTVFKVATGGKAFKTLWSFSGTDGEHPDSTPRFDSSGNLFSVTPYGGPGYNGTDHSGNGVLFELTTDGTFVPEHDFSGGTDGGLPGRIYLNGSNTIFGATEQGGSCSGSGLPAAGCGTVYSFVPSTGVFTTLYTFTGTSDGYYPDIAGIDTKGDLWGGTEDGGSDGYGTLFELIPNGSGGYNYKHLYDFTGGSDGAYPSVPALVGQKLVGGTAAGPITQSSQGAGVLYQFLKGKLTPLYTFLNDSNGGYPFGTPVVTSSGTIFGTAAYGGVIPCDTAGGTLISSYGCGTIYEVTPGAE